MAILRASDCAAASRALTLTDTRFQGHCKLENYERITHYSLPVFIELFTLSFHKAEFPCCFKKKYSITYPNMLRDFKGRYQSLFFTCSTLVK